MLELIWSILEKLFATEISQPQSQMVKVESSQSETESQVISAPSKLEQSDLDNMSLCAWKEARDQGQLGMRCVAHVIKNRIHAIGFPNTLHDVIFQKNAFTSMSVSTDPEFNLQPPPNWNTDTTPDGRAYAYARAICTAVMAGNDEDPTKGAHYYDNPKTATSGWFVRVIAGPDGKGLPNHPLTATVGDQNFYL